eukprot:GHVT01082899.1.p1 GENE.GHVT01082899.1~~GHVT01082899.1.p1  ORF type:complete len:969 (+),score=181.12 GHVT01082899.1:1857-4763(+)
MSIFDFALQAHGREDSVPSAASSGGLFSTASVELSPAPKPLDYVPNLPLDASPVPVVESAPETVKEPAAALTSADATASRPVLESVKSPAARAPPAQPAAPAADKPAKPWWEARLNEPIDNAAFLEESGFASDADDDQPPEPPTATPAASAHAGGGMFGGGGLFGSAGSSPSSVGSASSSSMTGGSLFGNLLSTSNGLSSGGGLFSPFAGASQPSDRATLGVTHPQTESTALRFASTSGAGVASSLFGSSLSSNVQSEGHLAGGIFGKSTMGGSASDAPSPSLKKNKFGSSKTSPLSFPAPGTTPSRLLHLAPPASSSPGLFSSLSTGVSFGRTSAATSEETSRAGSLTLGGRIAAESKTSAPEETTADKPTGSVPPFKKSGSLFARLNASESPEGTASTRRDFSATSTPVGAPAAADTRTEAARPWSLPCMNKSVDAAASLEFDQFAGSTKKTNPPAAEATTTGPVPGSLFGGAFGKLGGTSSGVFTGGLTNSSPMSRPAATSGTRPSLDSVPEGVGLFGSGSSGSIFGAGTGESSLASGVGAFGRSDRCRIEGTPKFVGGGGRGTPTMFSSDSMNATNASPSNNLFGSFGSWSSESAMAAAGSDVAQLDGSGTAGAGSTSPSVFAGLFSGGLASSSGSTRPSLFSEAAARFGGSGLSGSVAPSERGPSIFGQSRPFVSIGTEGAREGGISSSTTSAPTFDSGTTNSSGFIWKSPSSSPFKSSTLLASSPGSLVPPSSSVNGNERRNSVEPAQTARPVSGSVFSSTASSPSGLPLLSQSLSPTLLRVRRRTEARITAVGGADTQAAVAYSESASTTAVLCPTRASSTFTNTPSPFTGGLGDPGLFGSSTAASSGRLFSSGTDGGSTLSTSRVTNIPEPSLGGSLASFFGSSTGGALDTSFGSAFFERSAPSSNSAATGGNTSTSTFSSPFAFSSSTVQSTIETSTGPRVSSPGSPASTGSPSPSQPK